MTNLYWKIKYKDLEKKYLELISYLDDDFWSDFYD